MPNGRSPSRDRTLCWQARETHIEGADGPRGAAGHAERFGRLDGRPSFAVRVPEAGQMALPPGDAPPLPFSVSLGVARFAVETHTVLARFS